jgi:ArsR family transcriptional regulator, lead/cadmium/zinc/bismuth-responsive transcriptional repressor
VHRLLCPPAIAGRRGCGCNRLAGAIFHMRTSSTVKVVKPELPEVFDARKLKATSAGMPTEEIVRDAAEVFKALANLTRVRIIHALAHEELCVGDLARALQLSMSALSHQLGMLRRMKLVAARDEGRQTFYRVVDPFVGDVVHDCLAHVERDGARSRRGHRHPHGRRK